MFRLQSNVMAKLGTGADQIPDQATRHWAQNLVRSLVQILCNGKQSLSHAGSVAFTGDVTIDGQTVLSEATSGFVGGAVYPITLSASNTSVPSPYAPLNYVRQWSGAKELRSGKTVVAIDSLSVGGQNGASAWASYNADIDKFEIV